MYYKQHISMMPRRCWKYNLECEMLKLPKLYQADVVTLRTIPTITKTEEDLTEEIWRDVHE